MTWSTARSSSAYNCSAPVGSPASESECADEVAQVQALIDALPADPVCSAATPRRVVLTPDPLLDVRWGVSAWGFTLRADCVDEQRFRQFYLNHFARGPEDLCNPGSDFGGTPPCGVSGTSPGYALPGYVVETRGRRARLTRREEGAACW